MIALPRITLWQAAYVGALKAGAIVIPCGAALREKDLVYRANHSRRSRDHRGGRERRADERSAQPVSRAQALSDRGQPAQRMAGFAGLDGEGLGRIFSGATRASDPAICFYTSGTAHEPKAVLHSHAYTWCHRYIGSHWLDVRPGELHWGTADTGWAKAGYGVLFGPWMNGVTTFMYNGRLEPQKQLELLARYSIATLCATPTEYRLLMQGGSRVSQIFRRSAIAPPPARRSIAEIVGVWRDAFGLTIHDGYGQAETTIVGGQHAGNGGQGRFDGPAVSRPRRSRARRRRQGEVATARWARSRSGSTPSGRRRFFLSTGRIQQRTRPRFAAITISPATWPRATATAIYGSPAAHVTIEFRRAHAR